jgi:hypothetical protein
MYGEKSIFEHLKIYSKVDLVIFDDGSKARVLGKGKIVVLRLPKLEDALYEEHLRANSKSVSQFCNDND